MLQGSGGLPDLTSSALGDADPQARFPFGLSAECTGGFATTLIAEQA
jgi:hypothetical protein